MPRRYHEYAPEFHVLNVLSSAGASVLAVGYLLPFLYLAWSLRFGARAGANPWNAARPPRRPRCTTSTSDRSFRAGPTTTRPTVRRSRAEETP